MLEDSGEKMISNYSSIKCLRDLCHLRSAPILEAHQSNSLQRELRDQMDHADWFTVGIMAFSADSAISVLRGIERFFVWAPMHIINETIEKGPVFLKANQKTGKVYLRIEYGLGEGILLSCQHEDPSLDNQTFGPFPLDFFLVSK